MFTCGPALFGSQLPTFKTATVNALYAITNFNHTARLTGDVVGGDGYVNAFANPSITSGKYVATIQLPSNLIGNMGIGVAPAGTATNQSFPSLSSNTWAITANGYKVTGATATFVGTVFVNSTGNCGVIALDLGAGKIWLGGSTTATSSITWVGGGDPAAGTTPTFSGISGGTYVFGMYNAGQADGGTIITSQFISGFSPWPHS